MRSTRAARSVLVLVPAILALAACGGPGADAATGPATVSGTAAPAGITPSPSASAQAGSSASQPAATTSPRPSTGPTGPTTTGCPAGGKIPAGANTATTVDLDGDGRPDTLWMADQGVTHRLLGVRTASGAVFSTVFSSAAPEPGRAVAGRIGDARIILLDLGRSAPLYAVAGCRIVPAMNIQGKQYTFDRGFTGNGTGAGCPVADSRQQLAGYNAVGGLGNLFTVTRTLIVLSDHGQRAANGAKTTLGTKFSDTSTTVRIASEVTCGSSAAVQEPQS